MGVEFERFMTWIDVSGDGVRANADTGLNYVSCSPFRVPIARLAAAQAALTEGPGISSETAAY